MCVLLTILYIKSKLEHVLRWNNRTFRVCCTTSLRPLKEEDAEHLLGYCLCSLIISKFTDGKDLTLLTSHDASGILNSEVQSDNGSIFKTAVTQGVSKALGIEYHLHCSWRPQSSEKVEKANDIKRHLLRLTQETRFSWFKVLPIL